MHHALHLCMSGHDFVGWDFVRTKLANVQESGFFEWFDNGRTTLIVTTGRVMRCVFSVVPQNEDKDVDVDVECHPVG